MNNIFKYAPKELATDAFLCWLFNECARDEDMKINHSGRIFKVLCGGNNEDIITQVKCLKQFHSTDLIVLYRQNTEINRVLFENKTWSTIHSNQLERYHRIKCDYYRYLKLGFIDSQERDEATEEGYNVISSDQLYETLLPLQNHCQIINQYLEFLKTDFIDFNSALRTRIQANDILVYKESEAQRMFLSDLRAELEKNQVNNLKLKYGHNKDGTPWTQLDFYKFENQYGNIPEFLFYRIDQRNQRIYLRINQYAEIDRTNDSQINQKMTRLNVIQSVCNQSLVGFNFRPGEVNNRGIIQREVLILFLDDQENQHNLMERLLKLTLKIIENIRTSNEN